MSYNEKKFLDYNGLVHLLGKFDDYPTNDILGTVINSIDTALAGKVDDVQANGTSIVSNGTANIPIASTSNAGIVKVELPSTSGLMMWDGALQISPAPTSQIKLGTNQKYPITADRAHTAAFYGLAKAAGDTTQALSDNAVGTYTATAATAIKTMFQIQEGLEVVRLI